jgi:mannose-6-phosphate isomerase-like protein (cupin superfamily)
VTGPGYRVARLDELEPARGADGSEWLRLRRDLGIGAFGVNAYRAKAGGRVIEEHDETGSTAARHEEVYLVLSGRARFTVAGEDVAAPAGTIVVVRDPETKRGAIAEEDGTTVLAVGGVPGEPYRVAAWEEAADAWPLFEAGRLEEARELLAGVAERNPGAFGILYNLACAESRTGRTEDALAHLRTAVEGDERFREHARTDSDLDPLRDDPRFPDLS